MYDASVDLGWLSATSVPYPNQSHTIPKFSLLRILFLSLYWVSLWHLHSTWLQASAGVLMRSALFWGITQRRVVILYWRFGTTYRSHLQGPKSPRRVYVDFLTLDMTDTLSRNVGIGLSLDAALYPRKAQSHLHCTFTLHLHYGHTHNIFHSPGVRARFLSLYLISLRYYDSLVQYRLDFVRLGTVWLG
jgi:hypothetical protein